MRRQQRPRARNQRVSSFRQRRQQHLLDVKVRSRKAVQYRNRKFLVVFSKIALVIALIAGIYVGGRVAAKRFFIDNPDYKLSTIEVQTDGTLQREQILSVADLHEGERIYMDTILDGNTVFARSIRVKSAQAQGESQGTVTEYRADGGELTLRDSISPTPVRVRLNSSTRFLQGDLVVPAGTLLAGSLVAIKFNSEGNGRDVAREITILALPGTRYTFAGQVTHVDLRTGLVVISSSTDQKSYEIYLDPSAPPDDDLHPGAMVTVVTDFQGSRYVARTLKIDSQGK